MSRKTDRKIGRKIHDEKFLNSLNSGKLKEMLSVVGRDHELDVQIRNNYLNIYYRGGSIAKISGESRIEFDKFYFYLDQKSKSKKQIAEVDSEVIERLTQERDELTDVFKKFNYKKYFEKAKEVMNEWLKINPKPEREEQHKLTINNKNNESDYAIIDLEYEVSRLSEFSCEYKPEGKDKYKVPRFDIIAINKLGELCVIELKKGKGAFTGESGLIEHWECYKESIGRNPLPFVEEMKELLRQKKELHLIDNSLEIKHDNPKFMFAFAYDQKTSEADQVKALGNEMKKIKEKIDVIRLQEDSNKLKDNENHHPQRH